MSTAVVIVNYRTYPELERCLASLAPYLSVDDEVVVVDHESEQSALACSVKGHPSVFTIGSADNKGFAAGVNLGAGRTRSPYILLLNPDVVVEGPVVRALEGWLLDHPDVAVAGGRVLNQDGTVQPSARRFPDLTTWFGGRSTTFRAMFPGNWFAKRNLVGLGATEPIAVDWVSGACLMTRRDVFDRLGGFDEGFFLYWEDADYCSRAAAAGFRCMYVPTAPVRHAGGRSADHDPAAAIRAFHRSAFRLYWKRASIGGRFVAPLVRVGLWLRGERRARQARTG